MQYKKKRKETAKASGAITGASVARSSLDANAIPQIMLSNSTCQLIQEKQKLAWQDRTCATHMPIRHAGKYDTFIVTIMSTVIVSVITMTIITLFLVLQ